MAKPKSITLSSDTLDEAKAELAKIDEKLSGLKGSASARKAKAIEAVNQLVVSELDPSTKLAADVTIGEAVEAMERMFEEAKAARDLLAAEWLKANGSENAEAIAALQVKREATAAKVMALGTLLGIEVTVPKVRKGLGGGSSGATSLKGQWFRHDGDEKTPIAASNSSIGGIAWYWFGKCGADKVKEALAAKGITALASNIAPVELTIKGSDGKEHTATVSFEVKASTPISEVK